LQNIEKRLKVREIDCENFEFSNWMMKAQSKISFCLVLTCLALGLSTPPARAFSLLGPFESWMEYTNGLRQPGDIGGPMNITNEYRWNVPVVTYGFDQSFLDYFGTNGVAAVESAIQILNDLSPASQIVPTIFPFDTTRINYVAQSLSLYDLKSETLSLLLEQMGLAQPVRYMLTLRQWDPIFLTYPDENDWFDWAIPYYVVERNFDPESLDFSPFVNNVLYHSRILSGLWGNQNFVDTFQVNPFDQPQTAVADFSQLAGGFYSGLTYDDVGGLAYLLSTNNINYETLLPDVYGIGTNVNSFVNGARRPGVDKITFVPQPVDSLTGAFLPMTNQFTDTYITNGNVMQQQLARAISQPDFLFSVADTGKGDVTTPWFVRTGTTNWINNAALNGISTGAGPGIIQPPVQIIFNKLGEHFASTGNNSDEIAWNYPYFWGTFDGSTNPPILYPAPPQTGTNQMTLRMWLTMGSYPYTFKQSFDWSFASPAGAQFLFQTSTNLTDWVTLFTNSNDGSVTTYLVYKPASSSRFYRLVPQ
jgi:hypothetical protein